MRQGAVSSANLLMNTSPLVVGLGEILWDILPSGRQLGGAPANFAYCSHLLGNRGVVASRSGSDDLGLELRQRLRESGLGDDFVQSDSFHPTGTVNVKSTLWGSRISRSPIQRRGILWSGTRTFRGWRSLRTRSVLAHWHRGRKSRNGQSSNLWMRRSRGQYEFSM